MRILVFFALMVVVFDFLPLVYPTPTVARSFSVGEVLFLQKFCNKFLDYLLLSIYLAGYPFLIYGTAFALFLLNKKHELTHYVLCFVLLQVLAQVTWIIYPVSPPRLSTENVRDVRIELAGFTETFNPYPHGAFPSLHAGNGLLGFLFVWKTGRKLRVIWGSVFALILLSSLYLGEHYLVDLLGGVFYALAVFLATSKFFQASFATSQAP